MKIINNTKWSTRNLRSLICAVIKRQKHEGPLSFIQKKYLIIRIDYSKRYNNYSGYAYLNKFFMQINIPKTDDLVKKLDVDQVAFVIDHELMHVRGYNHRQFNGSWNLLDNFNWAKDFIIKNNSIGG